MQMGVGNSWLCFILFGTRENAEKIKGKLRFKRDKIETLKVAWKQGKRKEKKGLK